MVGPTLCGPAGHLVLNTLQLPFSLSRPRCYPDFRPQGQPRWARRTRGPGQRSLLRRNGITPAAPTCRFATIILWNTAYLERAMGALRQQGRQVGEGLLKHVAPVHWNHITSPPITPGGKTNASRRVVFGHSGPRPSLSVLCSPVRQTAPCSKS